MKRRLSIFITLFALVVCPTAVARIDYAKAPYQYAGCSTWKTEKLNIVGTTPDIAVSETGELVVLDHNTDTISVLHKDRGVILKLSPQRNEDELAEAYSRAGESGLVEATQGVHHAGACSIAVKKGIIHVLYRNSIRTAAARAKQSGDPATLLYRQVKRYDLDGHYLGGWGKWLRWSESSCTNLNDLIAVDQQGYTYVADWKGIVVKYDDDGNILARWWIMDEKESTMWLNPDGPIEGEEKLRTFLSKEEYTKRTDRVREERKRKKKDLERQIAGGEVGFKKAVVDGDGTAVIGFTVDDDGNLYACGPGFAGIVKIAQSGEREMLRLTQDTSQFRNHPTFQDLAWGGGRLLASSTHGIFVFENGRDLWGRLPGPKQYWSGNICATTDGRIYAVVRGGSADMTPWPDEFEPIKEETKGDDQ